MLALTWNVLSAVESAAASESRDLGYAWPLLGIPDPGGPAPSPLVPVEAAALAAFHRDRLALEQARTAAGKAGGGGGGREKGKEKEKEKGKETGPPGAEGDKERAAARRAEAAARAQKGAGDGEGAQPKGGPPRPP